MITTLRLLSRISIAQLQKYESKAGMNIPQKQLKSQNSLITNIQQISNITELAQFHRRYITIFSFWHYVALTKKFSQFSNKTLRSSCAIMYSQVAEMMHCYFTLDLTYITPLQIKGQLFFLSSLKQNGMNIPVLYPSHLLIFNNFKSQILRRFFEPTCLDYLSNGHLIEAFSCLRRLAIAETDVTIPFYETLTEKFKNPIAFSKYHMLANYFSLYYQSLKPLSIRLRNSMTGLRRAELSILLALLPRLLETKSLMVYFQLYISTNDEILPEVLEKGAYIFSDTSTYEKTLRKELVQSVCSYSLKGLLQWCQAQSPEALETFFKLLIERVIKETEYPDPLEEYLLIMSMFVKSMDLQKGKSKLFFKMNRRKSPLSILFEDENTFFEIKRALFAQKKYQNYQQRKNS